MGTYLKNVILKYWFIATVASFGAVLIVTIDVINSLLLVQVLFYAFINTKRINVLNITKNNRRNILLIFKCSTFSSLRRLLEQWLHLLVNCVILLFFLFNNQRDHDLQKIIYYIILDIHIICPMKEQQNYSCWNQHKHVGFNDYLVVEYLISILENNFRSYGIYTI